MSALKCHVIPKTIKLTTLISFQLHIKRREERSGIEKWMYWKSTEDQEVEELITSRKTMAAATDISLDAAIATVFLELHFLQNNLQEYFLSRWAKLFNFTLDSL